MKKKNVNAKLSLNKETIANLNDSMQTNLLGGMPPRTQSCLHGCWYTVDPCTLMSDCTIIDL